jgi:hypothetical protein
MTKKKPTIADLERRVTILEETLTGFLKSISDVIDEPPKPSWFARIFGASTNDE